MRVVRRVFVTMLLCMSAVACAEVAPVRPTNPAATASTTATIVAGGATLRFPMTAGYGGSFVYSENNVSGVVTAALETTTAIPRLPGPPPPGTALVAFEFTLNRSVTFVHWYSLLTSIVVPPTVVTTGHSFGEYGYDLTTGVQAGWNPGTVNGDTIDFRGGLGPVTLDDHTYVYVLVMM